MVIVRVVVAVDECADAFLLTYFRLALTSAGCTSPALLPQELRSYVITAAISVSESCLPNAAMAVLGLPLSTMSMCPAFGPVTSFAPSSGGDARGVCLRRSQSTGG